MATFMDRYRARQLDTGRLRDLVLGTRVTDLTRVMDRRHLDTSTRRLTRRLPLQADLVLLAVRSRLPFTRPSKDRRR